MYVDAASYLSGFGGVGARYATVNVLLSHVEEEDALKPGDGGRTDETADTLCEPEQPHDDALHGAGGVGVRQL